MGIKLNGVYNYKALVEVVVSLLACILTATTISGESPCETTCGSVKIQYPFGTSKGCYRDENFRVTCDEKSGLLNATSSAGDIIQIHDINLQGELRVTAPVAKTCFNSFAAPGSTLNTSISFSNFAVSPTKNKFTVVGCDTNVIITEASGSERFSTGCRLVCTNFTDVKNGSCSGIGCCQATFPKQVMGYNVSMSSFHSYSSVGIFNPCSYAFVVEDGQFDFSTQDLKDLRNKTEFPMILNWAIERRTCEEARNANNYACKKDSICEPSQSGIGYLCRCPDGFQGNPYLDDSNGCQKVGGSNKGLALASLGALLGLAVVSHSFNMVRVQKTLPELRKAWFDQNGGNLLQEQLSLLQGNSQGATIFTLLDIENFTNNFDAGRIIARGVLGIVYKGILPDNKPVAIKKLRKGGGPRQVNNFVREILALCQINHENVAQFLGCCLETEVPLLVYEYCSSSLSLFNAINAAKNEAKNENESFLPWEERLRIAAETADAISCLHSDAAVPIIHGNIKSSNILLDKYHRAKLTDCGALRLIPLEDETEVSPLVKATLGYLDPEYLHTGELNEKSDVYSFGVVVIELLTGMKAVEFRRAQPETTLVLHFVSAMKKNRLMGVIDRRIMNQRNEGELKKVASVARSCVTLIGEERPSMKQVAMELQSLITIENNPPDGDDESSLAQITGDVSDTIQNLMGDNQDEDGDNLV